MQFKPQQLNPKLPEQKNSSKQTNYTQTITTLLFTNIFSHPSAQMAVFFKISLSAQYNLVIPNIEVERAFMKFLDVFLVKMVDLAVIDNFKISIVKNQDLRALESLKSFNTIFLRGMPVSVPQLQLAKQQLIQQAFQTCYQSVGLIKSSWFNARGNLRAVNFGTAFLISNRILLTCSHNIYSEKLMSEAGRIQFVPNVSEGLVGGDYYRSSKKLIIKREDCNETFKVKPRKQELCLILLQQPIYTYSHKINLNSFHQVQMLEKAQSTQHVKKQRLSLKIVGYPYALISQLPPLSQTFIKRQQLHGQLCSINGFTIHHNAKTQPGLSGSPILAYNINGRPYAVGIHTHRGNGGINSGLFFTQEILLQIKRYVNQLNKEFNLDEKISFGFQNSKSPRASLQNQRENKVENQEQDYENKSQFDLQRDEFYQQIEFILMEMAIEMSRNNQNQQVQLQTLTQTDDSEQS